MTLLPLLESFSWHHLQKGGGYINPKRAEKWTVSTCWESWGQTHTVRIEISRGRTRMAYELNIGIGNVLLGASSRENDLWLGLLFQDETSIVETIVVVVEVAYPFPVWNHLGIYTPWFRSLVMLLLTCYIAFFILLYEQLLLTVINPLGNFDWRKRNCLTPLLVDWPGTA